MCGLLCNVMGQYTHLRLRVLEGKIIPRRPYLPLTSNH